MPETSGAALEAGASGCLGWLRWLTDAQCIIMLWPIGNKCDGKQTHIHARLVRQEVQIYGHRQQQRQLVFTSRSMPQAQQWLAQAQQEQCHPSRAQGQDTRPNRLLCLPLDNFQETTELDKRRLYSLKA